jgi:hypothetical protein
MNGLKIAIAYVIAFTLVGAAHARGSCQSTSGQPFGLMVPDTPELGVKGNLGQFRCGFGQVSPAAVEETFRQGLATRIAGCGQQTPDGMPIPGEEKIQVIFELFEQWDTRQGQPKQTLPSNEQIQRGEERMVDVLKRAEAATPGTIACQRAYAELALKDLASQVPPSDGAAQALAAYIQLFNAARHAGIRAEGGDPQDPQWDFHFAPLD